MNIKIDTTWKKVLKEEFEKPYFTQLAEFVKTEYKKQQVFPPGKHIFRAFDETPFPDVKVVIIGQDPYHGLGQAHGLCFSVNEDVRIPPSLQNIYKEIARDMGQVVHNKGALSGWANQGVLLLNAILTVRAGEAGSHQNKGWEKFTEAVIEKLSQQKEGIVFMLWGSYAQKKGAVIDESKHLLLKSVHPSPLSAHRGFLGCSHFSKANSYLQKTGRKAINW